MNLIKLHEENSIETELKELDSDDTLQFLKENNSLEYHYFLSPIRQNLFIWYPFKENGKLLEIGSGYGQLTELFTQKVSDVTAVEDSESKAEVVLNRAEKASVVVCDFGHLNIEDKFDYIILCNLFEYAKSFWDSENPYSDYLKYLKNFLKDDGVILLALSNRLGIKYFAGYKEEHTNGLFTGIDGYDNESNIETFTKQELIDIIQQAGFHNHKFFYPYPNHEFPDTISTDRFVNEKPYSRPSEYFDIRYELFREDKLNHTLARDNLAGFFSNSFLVEIRNCDDEYPSDEIDYVSLDMDRNDEFKSIKTISGETIHKTQISGNFNSLKKNIDSKFGKIKFLPCEISGNTISYPFNDNTLETRLTEAIHNNDKDSFLRIIKDYQEALFYDSTHSKEWIGDEFKSLFKIAPHKEFHFHERSSLDMTLDSIYIIDNNYFTTGYELIFEFPIPLEYTFYRSINHHVNSNIIFKEFISVREVFNYLNMSVADIDLFGSWDIELSKHVLGSATRPKTETIPRENLDFENKMDEYLISSYVLDRANRNKNEQLKKDIVVNQRRIIRQKNEEIRKKDKQIRKKNKQIKRKNKKIKEFSSSSSWKITSPLRKLRGLFKR